MVLGGLKRIKDNTVRAVLKLVEGGSKLANFGARLADMSKPISNALTKIMPGGEIINYVFQRAPALMRAEGNALHKVSNGENVFKSIGGYFKDVKNVLTN